MKNQRPNHSLQPDPPTADRLRLTAPLVFQYCVSKVNPQPPTSPAAELGRYASGEITMLQELKPDFPEFVEKIERFEDAVPGEILAGATPTELAELEGQLGIALPGSYKRFLQAARGFWLFGGAVQFGT